MTCVCSVGLDMIAVPGDTPAHHDRGDHRRRSGHRHDQREDHGGAHHSGAGPEGGRRGGIRGVAGQSAGDGAAPVVERGVRAARRPDSRRRSKA